MINITKVVTKNFMVDIVARIQNIFGFNLTGYERMVQNGIEQIKDQIKENKIKLKWYRYEITQLTNGAVSITLYGDDK